MVVTITLTAIGADTGPTFDLYTSPDGVTFTPNEIDVDGALLLAGYAITVPDDTTVVRIRSHGNTICTGYLDINLMGPNEPQLFFNFISAQGHAVMGINNTIGASYYITFSYFIEAYVDNVVNISQGHVAITNFDISTDGGSIWTNVASARAEVDGGILRSDTDSKSGLSSIGGITNISNVRVRITTNCGVDTVGISTGGGNIIIASTLPSSGTVSIICQDKFIVGCEEMVDSYTLDCTTP